MAESQFLGIDPEVIKEHEDMEKRKSAEDARILTSADIGEDFSLFSWGYSDPLKITRKGKVEYIRIPIKSFGIADITEAYQANMPSPPATQKLFKKDSQEAREFGYKHDIMVMQVNEADPTYLEAKRKHDNELGQETVLRGIGFDLKWNGQIVLKGSDLTAPNEIVDRDLALKAFRRLGFTLSHFTSIVKSIRELTQDVEAETTENL